MRPLLATAATLFASMLRAQFDYDTKQPFDTTCETLTDRKDAEIRGCGFTGPRGGRVNFIQVSPKGPKPPFAGAIFQHGGGQSMTNYISEALVLTRVGVVSIIPDAPARGEGKKIEDRDFQAEIVITERRVLDLLLQQPGVDPKRIGYVGHSYGGVAGGALVGIEPRFAAFVLLGATPSSNPSRETDPDRFLPAARAPILIQCARYDTDSNVKGCPEVHRLAGGPKQITWYDDDHNFTSLEALRDRLTWLEKNLKLKPVLPELQKFLIRDRRDSTRSTDK